MESYNNYTSVKWNVATNVLASSDALHTVLIQLICGVIYCSVYHTEDNYCVMQLDDTQM